MNFGFYIYLDWFVEIVFILGNGVEGKARFLLFYKRICIRDCLSKDIRYGIR